VNLKSKQAVLLEEGRDKKVRLSLKVPINVEKNAELVAHKVFLKTKVSDHELEVQTLLDKEPKLIHAILEHETKKTKKIKTDVYETYFETNLSSIKHCDLTNYQKTQIILDIINDLLKIHKEGYLHGDIWSANIIVHSQYAARFTDYGLTFKPSSEDPPGNLKFGFYGTIFNTPPEMFGLLWEDQLKSVDFNLAETFALGVALWVFLKKWPDWTVIPTRSFRLKVMPDDQTKNEYYNFIKQYVEDHASKSQCEIADIILKLMNPSPKERMTLPKAKEALENLKNKYTL